MSVTLRRINRAIVTDRLRWIDQVMETTTTNNFIKIPIRHGYIKLNLTREDYEVRLMMIDDKFCCFGIIMLAADIK